MYVVNIIHSYFFIHRFWGIWKNRVFWPLFYICFSSPRYFNKSHYLVMCELRLGSRFAEKQKKKRERDKSAFFGEVYFCQRRKLQSAWHRLYYYFRLWEMGNNFFDYFLFLKLKRNIFISECTLYVWIALLQGRWNNICEVYF